MVRRAGTSVLTTLVILVGVASAVGALVLLARVAARERERTEKSSTSERTARTELDTARHALRESEARVARLTEERERRDRAAEQATSRLRDEVAAATAERDRLAEVYRSAAGERDRVLEDLRAARRDLESSRNDRARLGARVAEAEGALADRARRLEEANRLVDDLRSRAGSLLRPLLRDLRNADAALRIRALDALSRYAGRELPFRMNGTPEEREGDASALEAQLLPK